MLSCVSCQLVLCNLKVFFNLSSCILYSLICQVGGSKDRLAAAMEEAGMVEAAAQLEAEHGHRHGGGGGPGLAAAGHVAGQERRHLPPAESSAAQVDAELSKEGHSGENNYFATVGTTQMGYMIY